jgi:uncharacterized protein YecE (DUF72 family)
LNPTSNLFTGCAGWALSSAVKPFFPDAGTHLERYARVFSAVEINSSFYRPHRKETYARWAASTPPGFRFTAKVPREITHALRLRGAEAALEKFLAEVAGLGDRLGALLVQLPPSAAFDAEVAREFLRIFRERFAGRIAWEARHASWFAPAAMELLSEWEVASVAADPAVVPAAGVPGAFEGFAYFRLHGSPRLYYSNYSEEFLRALAARLRGFAGDVFCIFDNTAEGAAVPNALRLRKLAL